MLHPFMFSLLFSAKFSECTLLIPDRRGDACMYLMTIQNVVVTKMVSEVTEPCLNPIASLNSFVTVFKLLNLSQLQFPHLRKETVTLQETDPDIPVRNNSRKNEEMEPKQK